MHKAGDAGCYHDDCKFCGAQEMLAVALSNASRMAKEKPFKHDLAFRTQGELA